MIGCLFRRTSVLGGWPSGSRVSWLWQPSRPVTLGGVTVEVDAPETDFEGRADGDL